MCSQADDPTGWSDDLVAPEPTRPRVLRTAGQQPASVALAAIGTLITNEEGDEPRFYGRWHAGYLFALREARAAVADAESRL